MEHHTDFAEAALWLEQLKETQDETTRKRLKELVVMAYMPLVKKIARGLARRSSDPIEDITQVGAIGLVKAVDLFKSTMGTSFKTYATYLITGEIRHYLRDKVSAIRAPREIKELSYRIHKLVTELTERLGEAPTDEQIAKELQLPQEKVTEAIHLERRTTTISFTQPQTQSDEDENYFEDKIADESGVTLAQSFENRIILEDAIKKLDPESRELIRLSFFEEMTQREISVRLGISPMQVSRKMKKALNTLFELITQKGMSQYDG
jgi:RNA polymerase sigma-B factor